MAEGKWIDGLAPEMPLAEAARIALAVRFTVVRTHLPLAVDAPYDDREHVHQLRVGTRRARAALELFADCLPHKDVKAAKKALRIVRQAAGDARDWDVFAESLEKLRALKESAGKPALDFLLGYALGERSAAQSRLAEAAEKSGPDLVELCSELPERAREPHGKGRSATFGRRAAEELGEQFEEFTAAVAAAPTELDELHKLRILGKHLRYAIEVFAPCFGPPLKERLYPAVEELQGLLGDLQDARVGIERMEGLRTMARKTLGAEWPRLRSGLTKMIAGMRAKLRTGRKKFGAWAGQWNQLISEYPLEVLDRRPAEERSAES